LDEKKLLSFGKLQFISIANILQELNRHVKIPHELESPLAPPTNLNYFEGIQEDRLQINIEKQTKNATDVLKQIYICSSSSGFLDMLFHNNEEICQDFYILEENHYPKKNLTAKKLALDILEKQGKSFDIELENYKNGNLFGIATTKLLSSLPFDSQLSKILIKRDELDNLFNTLGVQFLIEEEKYNNEIIHNPNEIASDQALRRTTHITKKRRSMPLDAVIIKAIQEAVNPSDTSSVWAELKKIAQSENRPAPLIGYSEEDEAVKWQGDSKVEFEIRKNFTARLKRIRKIHNDLKYK